jgi:NADPH:quinone reductase-like Zn-dependent oxidoreductase
VSHKVFLSYAFQDHALAESFKSRIAELLPQNDKETLDGFDVLTDVVVGEDIRQSIKSAIEAAGTVVLISSESADASPWVNYEIGLADALGKNLVIVGKKGAEDTALLRRFFDSAKIIKIENG